MDTPRPVTGAATLTGDADGDDKSVILTLGDADAAEPTAQGALDDGVVITLTLMTDDEDVSLPLMVGEITARVTLIDTVMGTDTFDDAYTSPWLSSRSSRHSARCCSHMRPASRACPGTPGSPS